MPIHSWEDKAAAEKTRCRRKAAGAGSKKNQCTDSGAAKRAEENRGTALQSAAGKTEIHAAARIAGRYTNAGKSTIMNMLLEHSSPYEEDKKVLEKDMLFATVQTMSKDNVLTRFKRDEFDVIVMDEILFEN